MFKEYLNEIIDFIRTNNYILVCCCCSFAKSCPTLCNPIDWSMPGSSVLIYLLEFAQNHAHWVSDAIQPAHSLLPSSPPVLNLSQHQGLFQWVGCLHQVELQLQHQSFQWIFRVDFLSDWLVWSCSPWDSEESSTAPQFEGINSSVFSLLYGPTLTCQFSFSFFWLA